MTQPLSQRLEAEAWRTVPYGEGYERCVHSPELRTLLSEAAQLARRVESAATGQVIEVGNLETYVDEDDNSIFTGYLIHATPNDICGTPGIIYKRVALVTLEEP